MIHWKKVLSAGLSLILTGSLLVSCQPETTSSGSSVTAASTDSNGSSEEASTSAVSSHASETQESSDASKAQNGSAASGSSLNTSKNSSVSANTSSSSSNAASNVPTKPINDGNNYNVKDGKMTEEVLHHYLNKAITFSGLITASEYYTIPSGFNPTFQRDFDFIKEIGTKYISRAAYFWSYPQNNSIAAYTKYIKDGASKIHKFDPEIILEASIFETCYKSFVNTVKIPAYVFEAFELPVEERTFDYSRMKHTDGPYASNSYWGAEDSGVPDITRTEAKLWFYYWATVYIDAGYEALHLGQIMLTAYKDNQPDLRYNMQNLREVLEKIRSYAKNNARRHFVLIAAHVYAPQWTTYADKAAVSSDRERKLLFDFHSYPIRPDDRGGGMDEKGYLPAKITADYHDAIYGKSAGGHHPQGYFVEENPYLVEFDNCNKRTYITVPTGSAFPYGNDESTWFGLQPEGYHGKILKQFSDSIKQISRGNGHIALPCHQVLAGAILNKYAYKPYAENGEHYLGLNYQDAIEEIFASYNKR